MNPRVTFVVPCYKLAHLLADCVNSILAQTFSETEILIMDDCSPDHTVQVAESFGDSRVKVIRNEHNIGHLRNYNKGIAMARGEYVWLISADDRLRSPQIVERYVRLLDSHPKVGYAFCPAVGILNGVETQVINSLGEKDVVHRGQDFLVYLLNANFVVAPSAIARKKCYDEISYFPLDMPWGGDWFLWCAFALYYDVAYFGEPMVNYRTHELSMTTLLTGKDPRICLKDDLILQWRIKGMALKEGCDAVVRKCRNMIAYEYARSVISPKYGVQPLTVEECRAATATEEPNKRERRLIWAQIQSCLGDQFALRRDFGRAFQCYARALFHDPTALKTWAKCCLLSLGEFGVRLRQKAQHGITQARERAI